MDLILNKKKFIDEDNLKTIVKTYLNFNDQISALKNKTIDDYDSTKTYAKDDICYHDNYIWRCQAPATGAWNSNRWEQIGDGITELTKADIEAMLGLSAEEVETMTQIILDTEVRLDKTYSSSKIYTDILQCLTDSKTYTLEQIGKASGASYRVVSITGEMTDEKIIYLLDNGTDFDMYILDEGVPTKIGNTAIDFSDYYTKTDIDDTFLTKAEATSTYATIATLNGKIDKTSIVSAVDENSTNEVVVGGKLLYDGLEAKIDKANIVTAVDENSTDDKVPSGKLLYNKLEEKVDKANIVTTIDSTSTDEQVSSAKALYDEIKKGRIIFTDLPYGTDILAWADSLPDENFSQVYFCRANECVNKPPNVTDGFIMVRRITNEKWIGLTWYDIRSTQTFERRKLNDVWGEWSTISPIKEGQVVNSNGGGVNYFKQIKNMVVVTCSNTTRLIYTWNVGASINEGALPKPIIKIPVSIMSSNGEFYLAELDTDGYIKVKNREIPKTETGNIYYYSFSYITDEL